MARILPAFGRASLALSALAILPAHVRAAPTPMVITILSPSSSSGSFGLSIGGVAPASCAAISADISLQPNAMRLSLKEVSPCSYQVMPATALAPGQYCIAAANFVGTVSPACFQVTGKRADPATARLALESAGADSWLPTSCASCGDGSSSCARKQRQRAVRLILTDVPAELSSTHAFAAVDLSRDVKTPQASDFFLFDVSLTVPMTVGQRAADGRACVAVYARAFAGSDTLKIGEACIDAVLPTTLPARFFALGCGNEELARWCRENGDDCRRDGELDGCDEYLTTCAPASPSDAATPTPGGDAATPGESDVPPDAGSSVGRDVEAENTGASVHETDEKRGDGCALTPGTRAESWLGLWLGLALLAGTRRLLRARD